MLEHQFDRKDQNGKLKGAPAESLRQKTYPPPCGPGSASGLPCSSRYAYTIEDKEKPTRKGKHSGEVCASLALPHSLARSPALSALPHARSLAHSLSLLSLSPPLSLSLARSLLSLALSSFELCPYIPPHAIVGAASLSYHRALVLTCPQQVSLLLLGPLVLSFSS